MMDINRGGGRGVVFAYPTHGYPHHQELCRKHLTLGKVYKVLRVEVHSSSSTVELTDFPGIKFNTVNFMDEQEFVISKQAEALDPEFTKQYQSWKEMSFFGLRFIDYYEATHGK